MEKNYTSDFFRISNIIIFNSLGFFFLDFLVPFIAVELFQSTGTEMGLLFSLRIIGYFISSSFVGWLSDVYNKKNMIIIGSTGRGLAYFIMYASIISTNLPALMISNLLLGFMAGFFWIPFDALIAEKSIKEKRSHAYGIRTSAQGKGTFIGAFVGFTLLISFEPNVPLMYIAIPIFGLSNLYASWRLFNEITDEKITSEKNFAEKTNSSNGISKPMVLGIIALLFVIFLEATNSSIAKPYIIPYFIDNFTNDITLASAIYIPAGVVSIVLAPRMGNYLDRMNNYVAISIASLLGASITYLLITTNSISIFAVLLTIDELIVMSVSLLLSNIFSRISIKHRGKLIGFRTFFTNLGGIIGPLTGGVLWEMYSEKTPFIVSIGIELLLIPFFIIAFFLITPYFEEKIDKKKQNILPVEFDL